MNLLHDLLWRVDWQAIATFAAVAAALWVGIRQTSLQAQQAKILEGQNKLKENEIKVSLLDRRLKVIEQLRELEPKLIPGIPSSYEPIMAFHEPILRARLIFPDCANELDELDKVFTAAMSAIRDCKSGEYLAKAGSNEQTSQLIYDAQCQGSSAQLRLSQVIGTLIAHASVQLDA